MSRHEKFDLSDAIPLAADEWPEEVRHLDIRPALDEVAEIEAARLRAAARRVPTRGELARLAGRIHDSCRPLERLPEPRLAGEPAWDMLLALYCLPARGERLGGAALSRAAGLPQETGQDWQRLLEQHGLIERGPQGFDEWRQLVRLTARGRALIEGYLTRLFYSSAPAPPRPDGLPPAL